MQNIRYFLASLTLIFLHFHTGVHAQGRIELRTCRVGNVIYTEDSRGGKCIPPLTPEGARLIFDIIKAMAPPPVSEEYLKNQRFCQIYRERDDVPNQLKYCGALSEMGSKDATDRMCSLHFKIDFRSKEAAYYCDKASQSNRLTGHFLSWAIHANLGDQVKATEYAYRGLREHFFYKKVRTRIDPAPFLPAPNQYQKTLDEVYLLAASENLFGASLESLGYPDLELPPSISLGDRPDRYLGRLWNNKWFNEVDLSSLEGVNNPERVRFALFVVPPHEDYFSGNEPQVTFCYLKDLEGNIIFGDAKKDYHTAACAYLAEFGQFKSAVDVDGSYTPAFLYGGAEIQKGRVLLVNQ